jgi:hypothetical protein
VDADWLNNTAEMQCHINNTNCMQQKRKDTTLAIKRRMQKEENLKVCNDDTLVKILCFWTLSIVLS